MNADEHHRSIAVQIIENCPDIDVDVPRLEQLVETVCARFGITAATVNIAVVGSAEIKKVNKEFLSRDRVTDVISFDLSDENTGGTRLFDMVVNGQIAAQQAAKRNIMPAAELALYVTHGLLHNLGFDDSTTDQAAKMHAAEDEILQHLGYGIVYNS